MTDIPELGRQAAHVLLDAIAARGEDDNDDLQAEVMNLALRRLHDIGAVTATMSDDDRLTVDVSNLAGAALILVQWLIRQVTLATGEEKETVLHELRLFLDL